MDVQHTMVEQILELLHVVGYAGFLLDKEKLIDACKIGKRNVEYNRLMSYLSNQLFLIEAKLENKTTQMPEQPVEYVMASESFVFELGRIHSLGYKLCLIHHLSIRIICGRMDLCQQKSEKDKLDTEYIDAMIQLCASLDLSISAADASKKTTMQIAIETLKEIVSRASPELLVKPALHGELSPEQWIKLEPTLKALNDEYHGRRDMALRRLDITIQAFLAKEQPPEIIDAIKKLCDEKRGLLQPEPNIDISDLLAAREDLLIIEKVSNSRIRKNTKSVINSITIGEVPDRGGRRHMECLPKTGNAGNRGYSHGYGRRSRSCGSFPGANEI